MKITQKLLKDSPFCLIPSQGSTGTYTFSKTPGRDSEDRWSLDRVTDEKASKDALPI